MQMINAFSVAVQLGAEASHAATELEKWGEYSVAELIAAPNVDPSIKLQILLVCTNCSDVDRYKAGLAFVKHAVSYEYFCSEELSKQLAAAEAWIADNVSPSYADIREAAEAAWERAVLRGFVADEALYAISSSDDCYDNPPADGYHAMWAAAFAIRGWPVAAARESRAALPGERFEAELRWQLQYVADVIAAK
jgi:hypothetical protein